MRPIYFQEENPENLVSNIYYYFPKIGVIAKLNDPVFRTFHKNGTVSIWGTATQKLPSRYQPVAVTEAEMLQDLYDRGWIENSSTYSGSCRDIVEYEIDKLFE